MSFLASAVNGIHRALPGKHKSSPHSVLIILSHAPYDGDTTWNAIRLAATLTEQGQRVHIFVMNDATDVVRVGAAPAGSEFDLQAMLRGLMARGVRIKICTTCVNRCGVARGEIIGGGVLATMADLAMWVADDDRILVF